MQIEVPEGMTVDRVTCQSVGMKDWNFDSKKRILSVILNKKQEGSFSISVVAHHSFEEKGNKQELNVPFLKPLNVERETGSVVLFAPQAMEVITVREKVISAQPAPLNLAASRFHFPNTKAISSWTFTRRPVTIPVKIATKPTRLTATIGTRVYVNQEVTDVETDLTYLVEFAGIDTFRFAVPEAISKQLQIELAEKNSLIGIRQKTASKKAENGWITWTIVLQRPVTGFTTFRVTYHIPTGKKAAGATNQLIMQPIRPLGYQSSEDEKRNTPLFQIEWRNCNRERFCTLCECKGHWRRRGSN